ncbi:MAG: hypothetical protein ACKOBT_12530 [Actinomycetota bacterium]
MARALEVSKSRSGSSPRRATSPKVARRSTTPARRPAAKKVTTRTARDRASISPVARAVSRKNAPKAARIFVYTVASLAAIIITLMMVVVIFQTRLAETQLNIDVIEDQIAIERTRYDELRLERSTLREPSRLVAEATALGMVPGAKTIFTDVDPNAVAEVLVSMGGLDPEQFANTRDPLKNYSAVKALVGG